MVISISFQELLMVILWLSVVTRSVFTCTHFYEVLSPSAAPLPLLSARAGLRGGPPRPRGSWSPPVRQQRLLPATGPDEQSRLWWEVARRTPHRDPQPASSILSQCLEQFNSLWFTFPSSYCILLDLLAVILVWLHRVMIRSLILSCQL